MEPYNEKREKLKEFYYRIKNCSSCELGNTRINFVFGSGNTNASIMFVGEAPGRNEDLQGKPFVGQAGKILDGLLEGIGFTRSDVFIANVLKCRPPSNRDPGLTEINKCKQYLFEQIDIIDPAIICTMGKYSTQLILNTVEKITKLRGSIYKINRRLILPINHPAAVLYTPSRLQILKTDFSRIKAVFDKVVKDGQVLENESGLEISILTSVTDKNIIQGDFPFAPKQDNKGILQSGQEVFITQNSPAVSKILPDSDTGLSMQKSDEAAALKKEQDDKTQQMGLF